MTAEGNLKSLKEFLKNEEAINDLIGELGSNGWNAIHVAVLKEHEDIILYFIEKYKIHLTHL